MAVCSCMNANNAMYSNDAMYLNDLRYATGYQQVKKNIPPDCMRHEKPNPFIPFVGSDIECLSASTVSIAIITKRRARRTQGALVIHRAAIARTRRLTKRIDSKMQRSSSRIDLAFRARGCSNRISAIEILVIEVVEPAPRATLAVAYIVRDGRCLAESARRRNVPVFVDEYNHPYADGARHAEEGCAVDPARSAFIVVVFEVYNRAR